MKLAQLASKPTLTKVIIDAEEIVKEYGEPLEFWMYDRHDMDTFMKMAQIDENDIAGITQVVGDMVRDETGKRILVDGNTLPLVVMLKVIEAAVSNLGNVLNQTMEK